MDGVSPGLSTMDETACQQNFDAQETNVDSFTNLNLNNASLDEVAHGCNSIEKDIGLKENVTELASNTFKEPIVGGHAMDDACSNVDFGLSANETMMNSIFYERSEGECNVGENVGSEDLAMCEHGLIVDVNQGDGKCEMMDVLDSSFGTKVDDDLPRDKLHSSSSVNEDDKDDRSDKVCKENYGNDVLMGEKNSMDSSSDGSSSSSGAEEEDGVTVMNQCVREDEGEIEELHQDEMRSILHDDADSDSDKDELISKGPIRSMNETEDLPPVPRIEAFLEPHHQTVPIGIVLSIMGLKVIVEGSINHCPLNDGSILWITESRLPLGFVDETFGPVKSPFYIVRYNSEEELPSGVGPGTPISFVQEFANCIFNSQVLHKKGYDASNANDEELDDEVEFSDDEKEAEYRRSLRQAKRPGSDNKQIVKPGKDNGSHANPGDGNRKYAKPGKDNGNHANPGDGNRKYAKSGDDNGNRSNPGDGNRKFAKPSNDSRNYAKPRFVSHNNNKTSSSAGVMRDVEPEVSVARAIEVCPLPTATCSSIPSSIAHHGGSVQQAPIPGNGCTGASPIAFPTQQALQLSALATNPLLQLLVQQQSSVWQPNFFQSPLQNIGVPTGWPNASAAILNQQLGHQNVHPQQPPVYQSPLQGSFANGVSSQWQAGHANLPSSLGMPSNQFAVQLGQNVIGQAVPPLPGGICQQAMPLLPNNINIGQAMPLLLNNTGQAMPLLPNSIGQVMAPPPMFGGGGGDANQAAAAAVGSSGMDLTGLRQMLRPFQAPGEAMGSMQFHPGRPPCPGGRNPHRRGGGARRYR